MEVPCHKALFLIVSVLSYGVGRVSRQLRMGVLEETPFLSHPSAQLGELKAHIAVSHSRQNKKSS